MKMHIDLKREGFQMTRERRRSNHEWPAWLNIAWNTPITDVGALYPDANDPDRSNGRIVLNLSAAEFHVIQWNDWIIREADGRLWVTDSTDPTIANIEIPAGPELKQAPDIIDEAFRLRRELDEAQKNYVGACQTIAAMHAAAVGGIQAPNRGVVEDVAALRADLLELRAKRPNQAAIDQVAESLCSLVGDDGRFREDIRRELRENFGEFGVNEFPELMKLRGYYRQIVATLGRDDVLNELRDQHAKQVALSDKIGELTRIIQLQNAALDTLESHADRLASALSWLALHQKETRGAEPAASVLDALRAHAMRRGADVQDAGPIQSPALIPAKKLPEGTALLYPGIHRFKGVTCARDVIVTPVSVPERTKLVIFDGVLFHVWQAFPMDEGTVLIVSPDSAVMEVDDEDEARAALAFTEKAATDGTLAKLSAFPRAQLATHPVDAMKQLGVQMDPDAERDLRAHCDAPVDVSTMNGGPGVLEQCGREHAQAMQRIETQRAQLNPNPPPCPHDTDGDGDCHLCHGKPGGCPFKGGAAHVPTREDMDRHDEAGHRCDSCREGFTCWANRTAPCLKRTDPDGVAEDEKGI